MAAPIVRTALSGADWKGHDLLGPPLYTNGGLRPLRLWECAAKELVRFCDPERVDVALVANIAQGVGGLSGVVSLLWQIGSAMQRRRMDPWPPELRAILVAAMRLSTEVEEAPRDRDWVQANIRPIGDDLRHIRQLIDWKKHRDSAAMQAELEMVALGLAGIGTYASSQHITRTNEEAARSSLDQRNYAREARVAAQRLLVKIAPAPPEP